MRVTRTTRPGECADTTCPAIYELDDPAAVAVQGTLTPPPDGAGEVADDEAVVLIPRSLLDGYGRG